MKAGTTGAFRVPGENDKKRRVVGFCAEMGVCVGNKYFEHKSLLTYAGMATGQDGLEVKSMIEGYVAICARYEGSERNGTRSLRSPCCTL